MAAIVITGGAGFIGSNAASFFYERGHRVLVFDNFSRNTGLQNRVWLENDSPGIEFVVGDLSVFGEVYEAFDEFRPEWVLHLGGQVAVTTSIEQPRLDFEANALGTLNVLEAMRRTVPNARLIFSSTNKVYGGLSGVTTVEESTRMVAPGLVGIDENEPLDFYSPYGCSKGAADQYVRDYGRIYNLDTLVIRQSCIYGPRQFGVEDQGWLAWFALCALRGTSATVFGNGKQVRDILHVEDLLRLYELAFLSETPSARTVNAGGGLDNTLSILEYLQLLEQSFGLIVEHNFEDARPGDQEWYVTDNLRARNSFGWRPSIGVQEGVESLVQWSRSI